MNRNNNKELEVLTMMVGFLSEHHEFSVGDVISKFLYTYGPTKANKLWQLINKHFETIRESLPSEEINIPTR